MTESTIDVTDVDADIDAVDEVEEVVATNGAKPAKKDEPPKRGNLPEGFVTPIGFAKILTEQGLHTNRQGVVVEVRPQMVYSYARNAPQDDPFPTQMIEDSNGLQRQVVDIQEALDWWIRKNERVAQRKQNAATKAEKKAAKLQPPTAEAEATDEAEAAEVVEAE